MTRREQLADAIARAKERIDWACQDVRELPAYDRSAARAEIIRLRNRLHDLENEFEETPAEAPAIDYALRRRAWVYCRDNRLPAATYEDAVRLYLASIRVPE